MSEIPDECNAESSMDLLQSLKSEGQAMMLRKVVRTLHANNSNNVLSAIVNIMGDDPEPLPRTPTFHADSFSQRKSRGGSSRRGRNNLPIRNNMPIRNTGMRYDPSKQNAWRARQDSKVNIEQKPIRGTSNAAKERFDNEKNTIQNQPRFDKEESTAIPPRESMQDFFSDIETLPDAERNRMIQICIKELIEENKLLRDANRRLVQKQRVFPNGVAFSNEERTAIPPTPMQPKEEKVPKEDEPRLHPADVRQKKKLNADAAAFEMSSEAAMAPLPHELYETQHSMPGQDAESLRYEDFVRIRRDERAHHEYEEMVAEQMYLEEMEMRRFHEMELDMYGGRPDERWDPRFYAEMQNYGY